MLSSAPSNPSVVLTIENVYGAVPPVTASAELYAAPTCAVAAGGLSAIASGPTTMLKLAVIVFGVVSVESTTCTVKL